MRRRWLLILGGVVAFLAAGIAFLYLTTGSRSGPMAVKSVFRAFHQGNPAFESLKGVIDRASFERMAQREEQLGRLQSWEFKDFLVQPPGITWGADVLTLRRGKRYLERVGGSGGELSSVVDVLPPDHPY
ncbi:MAG: hypothetical protein WAO58_06605 [Fimbriimonadaceae bacterium]